MMSEAIQKGFIAPHVDRDSAWWWEAIADRRLLLPHCDDCESYFFPPQPTCPRCGSDRWRPIESLGRARVYSWIVIHLALDPAFSEDVPYTIVAAELDEGVRLIGRLAGAAEVADGDRLNPHFYEVAGMTMLGFEPEYTIGR